MARSAVPDVTGVVAAAGVLTSCQRPAPRVTMLGGGKVVNRSASSYCVDATHCRAPELKNLPELTVAVDENVMIDLPRTVAGRGWQVRALDLSSSLADGAPFIVTVSPTKS